MLKITNTEARVHHVGDEITLLPGSNDVDEKAWGKVEKLPVVQHLLQKKIFVVGDSPKR